MNSSEELIKERNSLSQKTYTDTKSVCIILEASEHIPLGSPLGNPRIRNLHYGGCLCLPLFLSPFSPRGISERKRKSSAYLEYTEKKQTNCHPQSATLAPSPSAAFQALAHSHAPWSCPAQASSCGSAVLCALPQAPALGLPEADTRYK